MQANPGEEDGLIVLDISYEIRATNDRRNLVVPLLHDSEGEPPMTLPVPRLDDRSMQDIVDEAKGLIHRYCPDWTDHNVSDPGVALIELFAWMTEMMLYRLNQVPDRLYLKFLELMGIHLQGANAAVTDLLFRLTGPQPQPVRIPTGTQVATQRLSETEPVVFQTTRDLLVTPPDLVNCLTRSANRFTDQTERLLSGAAPAACFPFRDPGRRHLLRLPGAPGGEPRPGHGRHGGRGCRYRPVPSAAALAVVGRHHLGRCGGRAGQHPRPERGGGRRHHAAPRAGASAPGGRPVARLLAALPTHDRSGRRAEVP